jgi:hypothetical protein
MLLFLYLLFYMPLLSLRCVFFYSKTNLLQVRLIPHEIFFLIYIYIYI